MMCGFCIKIHFLTNISTVLCKIRASFNSVKTYRIIHLLRVECLILEGLFPLEALENFPKRSADFVYKIYFLTPFREFSQKPLWKQPLDNWKHNSQQIYYSISFYRIEIFQQELKIYTYQFEWAVSPLPPPKN